MPKADDAKFFERHVEKLVLVVCLLLLALAADRWVLSSPVSLKVIRETGSGSATVPPERVDEVLSSAAQSIQHKYDISVAEIPPVPRWAGKTATLREMAAVQREGIDVIKPFLPLKPPVQRVVRGLRLASIEANMPPPPQPMVEAYMELPRRLPAEDVPTAHGLVVYPLAELLGRWETVLKEKNIPIKAIVQNVIIERQQALANGQWGPIEALPAPTHVDAMGAPVVIPQIKEFTGQNVAEVRESRDELGKAEWQNRVQKPGYSQIWSATAEGFVDWKEHLPKAQALPGQQLAIVFHDDKLKEGAAHRYRVRLQFASPLLTWEDMVDQENVQDARQRYVETKPSAWSEPVSVARQVHFYLTGVNPMMSQVTVTAYARKWGRMRAATLRVDAGAPIGGPAIMTLTNPVTGQEEHVAVNFATGAIALRFQFDVPWMMNNFAVKTAKVLYLDGDGKLKARVQARDNDDPQRKRLAEEAK